MNKPLENAGDEAAEILGATHPLALGLGSPEGLETLLGAAASLQLGPVASVSDLRNFLAVYRSRVMEPLELPVVRQAYGHAERGESRELIALDRSLSMRMGEMPFAEVSALVGRTQLRRLRPMRGNRVLARYLEAVARGQAKGWHTVAYGLMLASFSIPLRQGLMHYGESTTRGFFAAASSRIIMPEEQSAVMLADSMERLGAAVGELLGQTPFLIV